MLSIANVLQRGHKNASEEAMHILLLLPAHIGEM